MFRNYWIALLLSSAVLWPALAPAREPSNGQILIDVSGSMDKNDRERLRWDAILTLAQLLMLSEENNLGVRYFTASDQVRIEHTKLDESTYARIEELAKEEPGDRGKTDVIPSLAVAASQLNKLPGKRYIVVISDGVFRGSERIAWVADKLKKIRTRVYFVCIGPGGLEGSRVNSAMVEACDLTGGRAYSIDTQGDLDKSEVLSVFLDVFTRISPPSLVLLTDAEGRFAINRSNRSFMALNQRGRRVKVVSPEGAVLRNQTDPFPARTVGFQKWNLVACERPSPDAVPDHWQSDRWRVVDFSTGQPVENAHVYVHGDVEIKGVDPGGFSISESDEIRLAVSLTAEDLPEWSDDETAADFLEDAFVDVEVTAQSNSFDVGLASGRLEYQDGGGEGEARYAGVLAGRLKTGTYRASLVARHQDVSTGRLAQKLDVPLRIRPSYYFQRVVARNDNGEPVEVTYDPATGTQSADLFKGAEIRYRLAVNPLLQRSGAVNDPTSFSLHRGELQLTSPDGEKSVLPLELTDQRGENLVYETPWVTLGQPGTYGGKYTIEGTVRTVDREGAITGPATREDSFRDSFAAQPVRCKTTKFAVQWDRPPALFGSDEVLHWKGRLVLLEGPPAKGQEVFRALGRSTIPIRVRGSNASYLSTEEPVLFMNVKTEAHADRIEFSGMFVGPKTPGTWTVEPVLEVASEDFPLAKGGELRVEVGRNLIDVLVTAERDGRRFRVAGGDTTPARGGEAATVFEDYDLRVEVKTTPTLRSRGARGLETPPIIELASPGRTRQLEVEGGGDYFSVPPFSPGPGEHEITVEADLGGASSLVRHAIPFKVRPIVSPQVTWQEAPRSRYFQHEVASLTAQVEFEAGNLVDWTEWMRGHEVVFAVRREGAASTLHESEMERDQAFPGSLVYEGRLPTDLPGRYEVTAQVYRDSAAVSPPIRAVLEVAPSLRLEARQGDRSVVNSRDPRVGRGKAYVPLALVAMLSGEPEMRLEDVRVKLRNQPEGGEAEETILEAEPRKDAEGTFAVRQELDPGRYSFLFEAELILPGNERSHVVWTSPPVEFAYVSPWPARLAWGVPGLLLFLALVTFLLFRRDPADLPLAQGKITWFYPKYRMEEFAIETGFFGRLAGLGKRNRRLRIGKGGQFGFGVRPQEVGLGRNAHVILEIIEARDHDGRKRRFLALRGHNVGARTPLDVNGHLKARILGQQETRVNLDSLRSANIQLQAEKMCMQVQLDFVRAVTRKKSTQESGKHHEHAEHTANQAG